MINANDDCTWNVYEDLKTNDDCTWNVYPDLQTNDGWYLCIKYVNNCYDTMVKVEVTYDVEYKANHCDDGWTIEHNKIGYYNLYPNRSRAIIGMDAPNYDNCTTRYIFRNARVIESSKF